MKIKSRNKIAQVVSSLLVMGTCGVALADTPSAQNVFISYASPALAASISQFATDKDVGGIIVWEMRGDTDPGQAGSSSLLAALNSVDGHPPVNAFWTNWGPYSKVNPDHVPTSSNPNSVFDHRAALVDAITYSFMETHQVVTDKNFTQSQTGPIGSIYFSDPWSDLASPSQDFCSNKNHICNTDVLPPDPSNNHPNPYIAGFAGNGLGNFDAFSSYSQKNHPIQKMVSIGGYDHQNSFTILFGNTEATDNFVNSIVAMTQNYKINGWDMDYEDPKMTQDQSEAYLQVLMQLDAKLPAGVTFSIDTLANPAYLNPQNSSDPGFAPGVLKAISELSHFGKVNLMTYDFHGAFDYNDKLPNASRTGFLTNLVMPSNTPEGYDAKFSMTTSLSTLEEAGVASNQIAIGLPAYGRALMNVTPNSGDTTGLFASLNPGENIPQGDMDDTCSSSLPMKDPTGAGACSGSFSYNYIVNKMLTKDGGFVAKDWTETVDGKSIVNGSTAFKNGASPAPSSGYAFTVVNTTQTDFGFELVTNDSTRSTVRATPGYVTHGSSMSCGPQDCPQGNTVPVPQEVLIGVQDWSTGSWVAICTSTPLDTTKYQTITISGTGGDKWGGGYKCSFK